MFARLSSGLRLGSRRALRTTPAPLSGGYDGWNEDDTKQTTRLAEDTFDKVGLCDTTKVAILRKSVLQARLAAHRSNNVEWIVRQFLFH